MSLTSQRIQIKKLNDRLLTQNVVMQTLIVLKKPFQPRRKLRVGCISARTEKPKNLLVFAWIYELIFVY
jgi:hypothetical protein